MSINEFQENIKPGYNIAALREDLLQKLLTDYGGQVNGFNIWDLVEYYFGKKARLKRDYESLFFVQAQLEVIKPRLEQQYGLFLTYQGRYRFVAKTQPEAERHVMRFTSRAIRAVTKADRTTQIAAGETYKLLPDNPVMQVAPRLARTLGEAKKLEEKAKQYLLTEAEEQSKREKAPEG